MSAIPQCANFVKKGGCWKSDVLLLNETEEAWVFRCKTCALLFVVSKDGIRDKSQFELAAKRKRQQEELERRWGSRKKIFV